ncbi:MAG: DUF58 domain-containing protein [Deltaproteobacteria bacterium]|nr:DUF58 domain-containing protein [Deltaproteobacteria bacterium]
MDTTGQTVSKVTPRLLAELKGLHFATKKIAEAGIGGSYKSAFRGRGVEFEELREYQPGDDIRTIDWKVTARSRKPYIKRFHEEREINVVIAVDISGSTTTGTGTMIRRQLIAQVGAALTLIALNNNDRVGLATFAKDVISYYAPEKKRSAVWRVLHHVLASNAQRSAQTNLGGVFAFLSRVLKQRSVIFVISDFLNSSFEKELATLSKRHDVTALIVSDPADYALPPVGLMSVLNPETGEITLIDTTSPKEQKEFSAQAIVRRSELRSIMLKNRISALELDTSKPFVPVLRSFFKARSTHRLRTLSITDQREASHE